MSIFELRAGERAALLLVPPCFAACGLKKGDEIVLLFRRPTLFVIFSEGARFALSGDLARAVIVGRKTAYNGVKSVL